MNYQNNQQVYRTIQKFYSPNLLQQQKGSILDFSHIISSTKSDEYLQIKRQVEGAFCQRYGLQFKNIRRQSKRIYIQNNGSIQNLANLEQSSTLLQDYLIRSLQLQDHKQKIYQKYIEQQQHDNLTENKKDKSPQNTNSFIIKYSPNLLPSHLNLALLTSSQQQIHQLKSHLSSKDTIIQQLNCKIQQQKQQLTKWNEFLMHKRSLVETFDEQRHSYPYYSVKKADAQRSHSFLSQWLPYFGSKQNKQLYMQKINESLYILNTVLQEHLSIESQLISNVNILSQQLGTWKNLYQQQKQLNQGLIQKLKEFDRMHQLQGQIKQILGTSLGVAAQLYSRQNIDHINDNQKIKINSLQQLLSDQSCKIIELQTEIKLKSQENAKLLHLINSQRQSKSKLQTRTVAGLNMHKLQPIVINYQSINSKVHKQDISKEITSNIVKQLLKEFDSPLSISSLEQLKLLIKYQKSTTLTVSSILQSKICQRKFIISAIQSFTKQTVIKSQLLYVCNQLNKNFAYYLNSQQFPFVILFKMQRTGRICGAFSLGLSPTNIKSGATFLFSLSQKSQCFYKRERNLEVQLQPICFLNSHLIFGNKQVMIRNNGNRELKISLNIFGSKYYEIEKQMDLVGEEGECVKFSSMEIHRIEL